MPKNPPRTLEKWANHPVRAAYELALDFIAFLAVVVAAFIVAFAAVSAFSG